MVMPKTSRINCLGFLVKTKLGQFYWGKNGANVHKSYWAKNGKDF